MQPLLNRLPDPFHGDDDHVVTVPQRRPGGRHDRHSVAQQQGDVGPLRQPQLEDLHPVQPGGRPDVRLKDVGAECSQR
jgi:hypothetical protein